VNRRGFFESVVGGDLLGGNAYLSSDSIKGITLGYGINYLAVILDTRVKSCTS
jgi:hypothetical protein